MNILWLLRRNGRRDEDGARVNGYTVGAQEEREGGRRMVQE